MFESVEPCSLALFTRVLGWDNIRVQALLQVVRADLGNLDYHLYSQMYVFYFIFFLDVLVNEFCLGLGRHSVCGMKPVDG